MGEETEAPVLGGDLNDAIRCYGEGRLPQAQEICRNILTDDPDQPTALSMLGVIAYAQGETDRGVELLSRAIAVKPDYAEAHNNLGNLLRDLDRLAEAEECYLRALEIKPESAEFHNNLGVTLTALGRLEDAVASYGRALAINSDFVEAHSNLGSALKERGQLEDAVASYRRAITIKPDFAEAHSTLGSILKDLGRMDEAFTCHRRAVALNPHNELFWASLAWCLETHSITFVDNTLLADLFRLLEQPTVRPSYLTRPIIDALRLHQGFSQILELTGTGSPETEVACGDLAEQLSKIPLFLRIMGLSPIDDLKIERMLTVLRRAFLKETLAGNTDERGMPFSAALAL